MTTIHLLGAFTARVLTLMCEGLAPGTRINAADTPDMNLIDVCCAALPSLTGSGWRQVQRLLKYQVDTLTVGIRFPGRPAVCSYLHADIR